MQNAQINNLPADYNKRYTIRHYMDLKHFVDGTPLSQMAEDLAKRIERSKRQFYNYVEQHIETNKKPLDEIQLKEVADYFDITVDELITANVKAKDNDHSD